VGVRVTKIISLPATPPPRQLADVRDDPTRFPIDALHGARTGLCVFAAQWHGRQDAYWLAETGIQTTCVDVNRTRLDEMQRVYPDGWKFETADAYAFVEMSARNGMRWDVVTADPFTGDAMDRCHRQLDLWCQLANRVVVMGSTIHQKVKNVPVGWTVADVHYRGDFDDGVYWTVLKPS
jgi:hypothetical protein